MVDVTRREPGAVDTERHQQPAVRAEGAGELAQCLGPVLGAEVDDRVHRHQAGQGAVGEWQLQHRGYGKRKARIALSRGRDHPRRQVETNDALDLSSKESRDMDWAATDVGDPRAV